MDSDDASQDFPYERIRHDLQRRIQAIGQVTSSDLERQPQQQQQQQQEQQQQQQQQAQQKHGPNQDQDQLAPVPMDSCEGGKPTGSRARQKIEFVRTPGVMELMDQSPTSYDISSTTTTLAPQPSVNSANSTANSSQPEPFDSPQLQPYDIKSIFECPICFDYAVPPICQCQNGHIVCQQCSSKINHCPTCRVPITEPHIRNLQLDKLAGRFQFPCKYNFNGCKWRSYYFKKREHEELCDFISYTCPCPGTSCKWTGLLNQVMPHLNEQHKSITTLSGEDIVFLATDINLKGAVDWVMIQSCFNQHFLLVLEKQELKTGQQQFFAIVQLIGSPKDAERFKYRLELNSNVSGHTRRLQWEAVPRSIIDGVQFAITNYDCLVFDSKMAQHFLSPIKRDKVDPSVTDNNTSQSENLGINVTIERVL